jgi:hypothetical protein
MTYALLAELEAAGVRLAVNGDRLSMQAAQGVLTAERKQLVTGNKPFLLFALTVRDCIDIATLEGLLRSYAAGRSLVDRVQLSEIYTPRALKLLSESATKYNELERLAAICWGNSDELSN